MQALTSGRKVTIVSRQNMIFEKILQACRKLRNFLKYDYWLKNDEHNEQLIRVKLLIAAQPDRVLKNLSFRDCE